MTKLTLINSPTLEQELEEIQLPLFDIIVNPDGTWFTRAVEELENDTNK